MSRKHKQMLIRIGVSAALLIACALSPLEGIWRLLAFLVPYAVIGWDVLWKAVRNIAHGQVFDENFLMSIATVGAFATGEYPEAVFVMLFYQVGEFFQSYAMGKSRRSISRSWISARITRTWARRRGRDGRPRGSGGGRGHRRLSRGENSAGRRGAEGTSTLDTKALTGESLPREVAEGDEIVSGCVNLTSQIEVTVQRVFYDSTVSKILDLVENASEHKSKRGKFYHEVCAVLYPRGGRRRASARRGARACHRKLVDMDLPRAELSWWCPVPARW